MPTKKVKPDQAAFDAVAESRKWKEAVARITARMTMGERMAWFRSQSSVPAIRGRGQQPEAPARIGQ